MAYRNSLLAHYISQKLLQVQSILETANYGHLPDEDGWLSILAFLINLFKDVSDFIKELLLCAVFVQAEMAPFCAQFTEQVGLDNKTFDVF